MSYLSLSGIQKSFGSTVALSDVNLQIEQGEFICLLGGSGCGKTTVLRLIAGLETPSAGTITLGDEDLVSVPCHQRDIGMVFQSLALFPHLNVIQNVAYALKIQGVDKKIRLEKAQALLDMVDMSALGNRQVNALSGGQKQRVAIARALATQPSLFLMDEPFSALDAGLREHLQVEVRKLQQRLGVTTIFVTHDQSEAMAIADRIVVLNEGRIEQAASPDDIYAKPQTRFVAEFIGKNNCLDVTSANGALMYQGQNIGKLAANQDLATGAATIAIRPEHLDFAAIDSDVPGLSAEVTLVRPLGAMVETELKVGDQFLVQTSMNSTDGLKPKVGDKIKVAFDLDHMWVIPS